MYLAWVRNLVDGHYDQESHGHERESRLKDAWPWTKWGNVEEEVWWTKKNSQHRETETWWFGIKVEIKRFEFEIVK